MLNPFVFSDIALIINTSQIRNGILVGMEKVQTQSIIFTSTFHTNANQTQSKGGEMN